MRKHYLLYILFICCNIIFAQTSPSYHPIEKDKWEKAVKGLNYDEKKEEEKKDNSELSQPAAPFTINQPLKVIAFILIAALLVFILLKLFAKNLFSKKISQSQNISVNDLDDKPMESDLEKFLREAIEKKDFRLAIRIYYLMLLKILQEHNYIVWKKNKTNMDYLSEMITHPNYYQLNNNTLLFEFIWYGERNIAEPQFNTISLSFKELLQKINSNSR